MKSGNSIFNSLNQQQNGGILQQFNQFRQNFRGDPQQQIQQMLNSGKITQSQYNAAVQKAQQFKQMFGGR